MKARYGILFVSISIQACIFFLFACKTTNSGLASSSATQSANAFIESMYEKYNKGYEIQDDPDTEDDCASFYVPADPGVPYRGTAVFFHGYTACPQQYWEMGQVLKKQGYATLAVLMPGQGRAPAPFAYADRLPGQTGPLEPIKEGDLRMINGRKYSEYYAEFIPKVQNGGWKTYLEFVEDVNRFVQSLPGEKVLGGLSVGGELATYAYIQSPGLYKRAILMAPYFGMPGLDLLEKYGQLNLDEEALYKLQKKIVTQGSREIEAVAHLDVSWGLDCYVQTRGRDGKPGRRGICDFRFENLAAINSVGDYILTLLRARPELKEIPQLQFVVVDWDFGANTVLARKAIAYQRTRFGKDQVFACFYPIGTPHSFFSRKDLIRVPQTPWLDSFYSQAVEFLIHGKEFKHAQERSAEYEFDGLAEKDLESKHARCDVFPVQS